MTARNMPDIPQLVDAIAAVVLLGCLFTLNLFL
jgi:hypothetical protein